MKIETPILKRLGPVPFWRGLKKSLEELDVMYVKSARKAQEAKSLIEKRDGEEEKLIWD
jgi:hypothetical protein